MLQKSLTFITAVIENLFFAGIVFGWANLYPVLVRENFFSENCLHSTAMTSSNFTMTSLNVTTPCESQKQSLSSVFVISTSLGLFSSVLVGWAMDRFGIWMVRTFLVNMAVCSLLATARLRVGDSRLLAVTVSVLHVSGLGLHMTNLQMANIFTNNRNMYVAFVSGALGSGSASFLILNYMYFELNLSFEVLFTSFACCYFLLNVRTFLLTPRYRAPENAPKNYEYGYKQLGSSNQSDYQMVEKIIKNGEKANVVENDTFKRFVTKKVFIFTVVSNAVLNFTSMMYISVFNDFMASLLERNDQVDFYVNAFGIIQFAGFVFSPLSGAITQHFKRTSKEGERTAAIRSCTVGLFVGAFGAVAMETCMVFPSARLQLVSMTMQVASKAFFVSSSNALISVVFPAKMFGKLYSVMATCQAMMLLLQQPLMAFLAGALQGDFMVFNSVVSLLSLLTLAQPIYVAFFYLKKENGFYDKTNEESLLT